MSEKLEFTGERFTPECLREIRYEHFHRYALAAPFCKGARVLDAACGEGYGSALLSAVAAEVVGVDISSEAIEHARHRYAGHQNLTFRQADVTELPFEDDSFDRVVSFETLEHLEAHERLLDEFRRVLRPDGVLWLSSPDKAVYTEDLGNENEFHVRELYRNELEQLVGERFAAHRLLGQRLMFHSVVWEGQAPERSTVQTLMDDGRVRHGSVLAAPVYFIAVCAAGADLLPDLESRMWTFGDEGETVYRHYYHEIRKNMAAGALLAERDAEIERLEKKLAEIRTPIWRRWFRRG